MTLRKREQSSRFRTCQASISIGTGIVNRVNYAHGVAPRGCALLPRICVAQAKGKTQDLEEAGTALHLLQHLIVSHHGEVDKGALRAPMFPGAGAVDCRLT